MNSNENKRNKKKDKFKKKKGWPYKRKSIRNEIKGLEPQTN